MYYTPICFKCWPKYYFQKSKSPTKVNSLRLVNLIFKDDANCCSPNGKKRQVLSFILILSYEFLNVEHMLWKCESFSENGDSAK